MGDRTGSGSISVTKVHEAFEVFDIDGDGIIDKSELAEVEAWSKSYTGQVQKAFAAFDLNGDGIIDQREFKDALQACDKFFTPRVIGALVDEADADGDGCV